MPDENPTVERRETVAVPAVPRPAVRNAPNEAAVTGLEGAVRRLAADGAVRAVILTGAGDKAFVAEGTRAFLEKRRPRFTGS